MAQMNETFDQGGFAPHKNYCPHAANAINLSSDIQTKLQAISLKNGDNGQVVCSENNCDKTECWFCLKCHKILCGRYGNQHMLKHYQATNKTHCMALGINDLSFWCFECDDYINHLSVKPVWDFYSIAHIARFDEEIPDGLRKQTTFDKNASNTFTMETIDESKESDAEQKNNNDVEEKKNDDADENNADSMSVQLIDSLLSNLSLGLLGTPKLKSALFYHEDCLKHRPNKGSHVERPERVSVSYQMLCDHGIMDHLKQIKVREAKESELTMCHKASHVARLKSNKDKLKGGWYDSDTFFCAGSYRAALLAAGSCIDLMLGIMSKKYQNGFALVRPPGHHCEKGKAMGFCLLNNAVIASKECLRQNPNARILIIDWDVHHGNGIQNMLYDNEQIVYFSVHRYDNGYFYPSTGDAEDCGNGFNINVPLNVSTPGNGHGDREYLLIWRDVLLPICREFKPDIILISAGFDASIGDPLGGMRVTPPCYGLMTRLLLNECSQIGVILEGGYNLETMPRAICCVNYALMTGPKKQKNEFDVDEFEEEFLSFIDEKEKFEEWKKDYGKLLGDEDYTEFLNKHNINETEQFSVYESCKQSIKEVLTHQQKYWKYAKEMLQKYNLEN